MAVIRIDLAYDGAEFHGFARQPAVRTVQGELEMGLERILGGPVETTCAGRTDAGVHARHQVISFEVDETPDLAWLRRALDSVVGDEVAISSATVAGEDFNARFAPTFRRYRYFVDPRTAANPLHRNWVWHVGTPLDIEAMDRAAAHYVGEHDFASFCRQREGATTMRTVLGASWSEDGGLGVFEVKARAFCHQMVRSLVGLGMDVGRGSIEAASVPSVIEGRDRQLVGTVAPPHGLILWEVGFESDMVQA